MKGAENRKIRCVIIGAGVSGILIAQKLQESLKDRVEFHIFEKNHDIGGTWLENRYPGCACDVPSHIYQFTFCPNPHWSSLYASSAEIQSYLKAVTCHYELHKHISFKSSVERAVWDAKRSIWTIWVRGQGAFECEILFNAGGILNNIQWPHLKNLSSFQGSVVHTAAWDENLDVTNKKISIVGAGASAIQLLPAIQKNAKQIDVYIRTPSWIVPAYGSSDRNEHNHKYTPEEQTSFLDQEFSAAQRKVMESSFNGMFKTFWRDSPEQHSARSRYEISMRNLIREPKLQAKLIPSFQVGCRRINPGERYLEALQQSNVTPIFESIDEVTPKGIVVDGNLRHTDVIIAATGFDTSFRPRFPIVGSDGVDLRDLWLDEPQSYFGLAVSGYPNYLMFLGPNTPIANGSLMGHLEATAEYFVRLLRKFLQEQALSFDVCPQVQKDFNEHTQEMMQSMVWTGPCNSWYKSKTGKVSAIWPGSSLHYRQVLQSDRWEDFRWKHKGNRFKWWGKGLSDIEGVDGTDLAYYIRPCLPLPLEAYYRSSMTQTEMFSPGEEFRPRILEQDQSNDEGGPKEKAFSEIPKVKHNISVKVSTVDV